MSATIIKMFTNGVHVIALGKNGFKYARQVADVVEEARAERDRIDRLKVGD